MSPFTDSEIRQQDAAAERLYARPLSIMKMLASDPNLDSDMARVLDAQSVKAEQRRFGDHVPSAFGSLE